MLLISRNDLVCRQAVELVTDYLEGRLPRRQRRRFESHLAACPHCTRYLDQIRTTVAALGRVEVEDLDAATRDGLIELYQRYRAGGRG
jgi:anti-sigma factor RsiW